jgi:hypothetical protein
MPGPISTMLQSFLSALTGRKHSGETAAPGVVLHDPAAARPHDLDDPYLDEHVQKRFGGAISRSMQDK